MPDLEHGELPRASLLRSLPGYPFFPCRICQREGFKGMGGCDHTAFERARAMHPTLSALNTTEGGAA